MTTNDMLLQAVITAIADGLETRFREIVRQETEAMQQTMSAALTEIERSIDDRVSSTLDNFEVDAANVSGLDAAIRDGMGDIDVDSIVGLEDAIGSAVDDRVSDHFGSLADHPDFADAVIGALVSKLRTTQLA